MVWMLELLSRASGNICNGKMIRKVIEQAALRVIRGQKSVFLNIKPYHTCTI